MAFADSDRKILTDYSASIKKWTDIFLNDSVSSVLNLRETYLRLDLLELRRIRWFSIHTEPELEKLWLRYVDRDIEDAEAKASLHDYIMTGCTYMVMQNPTSDAEYESFITHVAKSLSWQHRAVLVPQEERQYAAPAETFINLLKLNHWLLFLVLLSMSDIE